MIYNVDEFPNSNNRMPNSNSNNTKTNMINSKVYVDMDGVIADFFSALAEFRKVNHWKDDGPITLDTSIKEAQTSLLHYQFFLSLKI